LREAISTSTGRRRIGKELVSAVESALAEVGLQSIGSAIATDLPFGTKKLVDLARATVSRPRFLLLDEPTAGIAESDYSSVQQSINRLSNEGVGMIVVAHHLNFVDQVAHRVVCLSTGSILATGTPQEIRKNPKVIDAYIGVGSQ
jgi:ABC-type branched-subunit amino acid transport system ATPase component